MRNVDNLINKKSLASLIWTLAFPSDWDSYILIHRLSGRLDIPLWVWPEDSWSHVRLNELLKSYSSPSSRYLIFLSPLSSWLHVQRFSKCRKLCCFCSCLPCTSAFIALWTKQIISEAFHGPWTHQDIRPPDQTEV